MMVAKHYLVAVPIVVFMIFALACNGARPGNNANINDFTVSVPQHWMRDVDLLIVMDNSSTIMDEIAFNLSDFQHAFMWLDHTYTDGRLPNVHIGVISTDLGAGSYEFGECAYGGDQGNLQGAECLTASGGNYIIDVEPRECNILKEYSQGHFNGCSYHDCTDANCQHEPSTSIFTFSSNNCPRCRNFLDQPLADKATCLFAVPSLWPLDGCSFKQPLESARLALGGNPANAGFLREEAMLGVVIITDEDDCSAADPGIYSDEQDSIDSQLGFHTPFRCFEFGVSCDNNDRAFEGSRNNCVAREDGGGYLHSVSRYVDFLRELKDPQLISVAVLTGPTNDGTVETAMDATGRPELLPSCTTSYGGARPAVRLSSFVSRLAESADFQWSLESICEYTIDDFLLYQGAAIIDRVRTFDCLPAPLLGCSDVAAWWGQEGDGEDCNDVCQPECMVIDVQHRGTSDEVREVIPRCVEVDPDGGIISGNLSKELAYAGGRPEPVDALLPVTACWYVDFEPGCYESKFSMIKAARRSADVQRAFLEIRCLQGTLVEEDCTDGIDNDQDCLTDMEDDECQ